MKKMCILSMQMVQNFGSLLQSYSLKQMLEKLGGDVHFIDIERRECDDSLVNNDRLNFKSEVVSSGFMDKLKKIDKYFLNRIIIKKLSNQQNCLFDNFRDNYLNIRKEDNNDNYDLCVIGSDEVFNCMIPSPWGFTSQLFGNVKQAKEVITYAASCGATTIYDLNDNVKCVIKKTFGKVSGFSARDKNTKEFIQSLTNSEVYTHLDPVLVGDFSEELNSVELNIKLPKRYCIVYSYYNRIKSKNEIKSILKFCKEKGLEPIAIGAPQMWIKKYIICSPFEMLKIFQLADFIITDTFHGAIFSQKFNGHFAVMLRESNKNKLSDLLERINGKKHLIDDFSKLNEVYHIFEDRSIVKDIIDESRKITIKYLSKYTFE